MATIEVKRVGAFVRVGIVYDEGTLHTYMLLRLVDVVSVKAASAPGMGANVSVMTVCLRREADPRLVFRDRDSVILQGVAAFEKVLADTYDADTDFEE